MAPGCLPPQGVSSHTNACRQLAPTSQAACIQPVHPRPLTAPALALCGAAWGEMTDDATIAYVAASAQAMLSSSYNFR